MSAAIPSAIYYQYFSHMFHGEKLIPFAEYQPDTTWDYPPEDRTRFETLFLTDLSYIKDCRILDLGCHTGYFSYVMKHLGAQSVHGINARQGPLDIANYAFSQLEQTDYKFEQGNIEDLDFLSRVCKDKDTVFLGLTLEHLRNPYAIIETISNSGVKNFIIESTITSDEGRPTVTYFLQTCESAFTAHDKDRKIAFGSCPNLSWFETVLYFFDWHIQREDVYRRYNPNWFATPDLVNVMPKLEDLGFALIGPKSDKSVMLHCKKFDKVK